MLATVLAFTAMAVTPVYAYDSGGEAGFGDGSGSTDPIDPVNPEKPDPEAPVEEKPDVPGTNDPGYLSLNYVPSFNFGTELKVSPKETKYPSLISSTVLGPGGKYNAPFIQVTDQRGANKYKGWDVTVKSGAFTVTSSADPNDVGTTLNGAQIHFAAGNANSLVPGSNRPVGKAIELDASAAGAAKSIFTAGDGVFGLWVDRLYPDTLPEGKTFAPGSEFKNENVKLVVPAYQAIPGASYKVTMTWTLAAV